MQLARRGMTLLELLIVMAIMAMLVGLLLPAVQKVRAASDRTACSNNLRQLAIALHGYHCVQNRFPPGCSFQPPNESQPHMSWLCRLLPHVEQTELWQQSLSAFAANAFFETPPHVPILGRTIRNFTCPSDNRSQQSWNFGRFSVAFTDYLGVEGLDLKRNDGVLFLNSQIRLTAILDGASNTLLAGERPPSLDNNLGWWYAGWGQQKTGSAEMILGVREIRVHPKYKSCPDGPYEFRLDPQVNICDAFHFWSFHSGGANFAFCDGSVRFLAYSADSIMPALATRAGGESVQPPD